MKRPRTRLAPVPKPQTPHQNGVGGFSTDDCHAAIDALIQKITHLEQQAIDLRLQLEERDQDLAAARDANRELMAQLNTTAKHG